MAFIPNGSGLWTPDTNVFQSSGFSVPDGTGYTIRKQCLHSGLATNDDRIIFPAAPGTWSVLGPGYWTTPPTAVINTSANASVSAWMAIAAITDQWCTASITSLVEAGGTGAGIGPMVRVDGSGHGYYGMIAKFGGVLRYEAGVFNGTPTAKFTVPAGALGPITLVAIGNTITLYSSTPNTSLVFLGSFNDTGHTSGVPGAIGSSGSNGHPLTVETQSNWLAAEIGGC